MGSAVLRPFLAGCGSSATPTPLPTDATVEVGSVTLATGARAYVPIAIRDITDPDGIGAYHFFITFDPGVVRVAAVFGGDPPFGPGVLPKEEGEQVGGVPIHNINNEEGWVVIVDFQASQIPGPTEDLAVAYLEVEAVAVYGGDPPFGSVDIEGQKGALRIYRINDEEGWVTVISFQPSQIPGPIEDIVVAYVEMRAVGSAGKSSTLDLAVKGLPSAEGVNMASTVINGTVVIR